MTLLNIFHSGGLWATLLLPLAGVAISMHNAYKASKSGSWTVDKNNDRHSSDENVPIYKTGWFKFGVLCFIAFLLMLIFMSVDYKGV